MSTPTCCTCASILPSSDAPSYSLKTEKALSPPRSLPCCDRLICSDCITKTPRFATYCPFCQVSTSATALPQGGLRQPPAYTSTPGTPARTSLDSKDAPLLDLNQDLEVPPPAYAAVSTHTSTARLDAAESGPAQQEDTIHHLHPHDTLPALSLAYHVPLPALLSHNRLYTSTLLPARRTLLIPRAYYTGPSLSATPVESEEETERKAKLRRFMVQAKCADYSMAELYLGQAEGSVEEAVKRWKEDEEWEKENQMGKGKGAKRMNGYKGGGLIGQLRS